MPDWAPKSSTKWKNGPCCEQLNNKKQGFAVGLVAGIEQCASLSSVYIIVTMEAALKLAELELGTSSHRKGSLMHKATSYGLMPRDRLLMGARHPSDQIGRCRASQTCHHGPTY